jgi:hypothetical protein
LFSDFATPGEIYMVTRSIPAVLNEA